MAEQHTFQVLTKRPERALALLSQHDWHERMVEALALVPDDAARIVSMLGRAHKPRPGVLPLPNVVFLFSAETQARFDERVADALAVPAVCRGVSLEPLLGPVDLSRRLGCGTSCSEHGDGVSFDEDGCCAMCGEDATWYGLEWAIVGCESGPRRRPMAPYWAEQIRDQCCDAGVPFYLKQMALYGGRVEKLPELDGRVWAERPEVML